MKRFVPILFILFLLIFGAVLFFWVVKNKSFSFFSTSTQNSEDIRQLEEASQFEYAWVTFTISNSVNFVVKDSKGNRTGYDPTANIKYNEIPNGLYNEEITPGEMVDVSAGNKTFEVKVFDDYNFEITIYGDEGTTYFYDYAMTSNSPNRYNAREVKTDLIMGAEEINVLNFSYNFD